MAYSRGFLQVREEKRHKQVKCVAYLRKSVANGFHSTLPSQLTIDLIEEASFGFSLA